MDALGSGKGPFAELVKPPASGLWGSVGWAGREVWVATEVLGALNDCVVRLFVRIGIE